MDHKRQAKKVKIFFISNEFKTVKTEVGYIYKDLETQKNSRTCKTNVSRPKHAVFNANLTSVRLSDIPRRFVAQFNIFNTLPLMQILFEDKDLLVINKPAGLSSESGTARHPSAEKEALEMYRQKLLGDDSGGMSMKISPYLRAVHRLDRASSGVLVMAKSKTMLTALMNQFEQRSVEKTYQALVEKAPNSESGVLSHWLKRDESGKRALVFDKAVPDSQPCESEYKLIEKRGDAALLEIRPRTGRFHQIRAQLAHIGCPIVGDVLYGGQIWREHEIKLHAQRLSFEHPRSNAPMVIEAPWQE